MTLFNIPAPIPQLGVFATVTLDPHELPVGTLAQGKIRSNTDYLREQTLLTSTSTPSTVLPEMLETAMLAIEQVGVITLP